MATALVISLVAACWQDAAAQESSAGNEICVLDPGAKKSLLFEQQCLNDQQALDLSQFSTARQKGWVSWQASPKVDFKAGLLRDDSDVKMAGFGLRYSPTPTSSVSGQTGFGGAPYSPQAGVTIGFRFDF